MGVEQDFILYGTESRRYLKSIDGREERTKHLETYSRSESLRRLLNL